MIIKNYKKLSSNLYEINFENGKKIKLYDDIILKYELLLTKKIKNSELEKIEKENELYEAYFKSIKYLSSKMRTEFEIEKYLKKHDFSNKAIDYTIDRLKIENYLDNQKYIKAYIHDNINLTLYGPNKIMFSLKQLGIKENDIIPELETISYEFWNSRIKKIITKKYKMNKNSLSVFKSKIYSYLISIGYNQPNINDVINSYNFVESKDNFIKEAFKTWNKLSAKYNGDKLITNFKNKMYLKGYSSELINDFLQNKNTAE